MPAPDRVPVLPGDLEKRLVSRVLPSILAHRFRRSQAVRVWVVGAGSGEMVYLLAMLLFETRNRLGLHRRLQVFGTDRSEEQLQAARGGIIAPAFARTLSEARRDRFFVSSGAEDQIRPVLRKVCLFARHDPLVDPPLRAIDMVVVCDPVLLDARSVSQVMNSIHYALVPGGFLVIPDTDADAPPAMFQRKAPRVFVRLPEARRGSGATPGFDRTVVERSVTAGLVVDEAGDIFKILGHTGLYLKRFDGTRGAAPGAATLNLTRLVRRDFGPLFRSAFAAAVENDTAVLEYEAQTEHRPNRKRSYVEVIPLNGLSVGRRLLVLFGDINPASIGGPPTGTRGRGAAATEDEMKHARLARLMAERRLFEQDLRSANEDLIEKMGELHAANEQLQVSHEAIGTANEELESLNRILVQQNRRLAGFSDDLTNRNLSTDIPIVMLDGDLRVRSTTPAAERVAGITEAHVGAPLQSVQHALRVANLTAMAAEVLRTGRTVEIEVRDALEDWYTLRLCPYKTRDGRIDGVVLILFDIGRIKSTLEEVERARNFSQAVVESVRHPLLVLSARDGLVVANDAAYRVFLPGAAGGAAAPQSITALQKALQSRDFRALVSEAMVARGPIEDREVRFEIGGRKLIMAVDVRPSHPDEGLGRILVVTLHDITHYRQTVQHLLAENITVHEARQQAELSLRGTRVDLHRSREELRRLTGRLMISQDEERKRVARELHDDLSQTLALLQVQTASLLSLAPDPGGLHDGLLDLVGRMSAFSDQLRRVAHDLHPSVLTHLGLPAALRSFCDEFARREQKIRVHLETPHSCAALSAEVALCAYRVVQEGLRNVAKHSGADAVSVRLQCQTRSLRLVLEDDGKGFDPAAMPAGAGLGLLSMQERVRMVGGSLTVRSRPGAGTRIELLVSIDARRR